jgi:glycosyltransferase involved in cell wall biosynthesis
MKLLIDFSQIPIKKTGVGVYAKGLIENLLLLYPNIELYILIYSDEVCFESNKNIKNINFLKIKLKRSFIIRFFIEQFYIPYISLVHKIDIVHSLHYSFPIILPRYIKRVVTYHDMSFFLFPHLHQKFKLFYFKLFIFLSKVFCIHIIFVSRSTQNDFIDLIKPRTTQSSSLIPNGIDSSLYAPPKKLEIKSVLCKYKLNTNYILFIGTLEPRKNIKTLIQAFSIISNSHYKLVICGKKGWFYDSIFQLVYDLGLTNKLVFTDFVTEFEKKCLLYGSSIFVYPSLYEGFGYPILESMVCGIPTITSNISSMPEVADDACLLLDNPQCPNELAEKIKYFINSQERQNDYSARGITRSKKFSLVNNAKLTYDCYLNLLSNELF